MADESVPPAGQHGWPTNDDEFIKKYEKLKKCQHMLRPEKLSTALSTMGVR